MTEHEYWVKRKKQKLEKLLADVNLAIMVKRGEDAYDEGTPEEQHARAEAAIMEGKRFVAKMFFTGEDHQAIIRELEKDYRLVGDVSLLDFSEYAKIMKRLYENMQKISSLEGQVLNAQREYECIQRDFALAELKLSEAKVRRDECSGIVEESKAAREAEVKRLGLAGVAGSGVADGAGADGAGDGAGADGAGDGAGE